MLEELKKQVCEANLLLPKYGLVAFTWGNVSGVDRDRGLMVIKPSGVEYEKLTPEDMVVTDLSGKVVEGTLKPSSDTLTHLELYRAFAQIGGVVHTHSVNAVAWSQARRGIPPLGTTHGDYFDGEVPCTRLLNQEEIRGEYEKNTGLVIAETFKRKNLNPENVPAVLVASHGPFTWGKDCYEAVHNAAVLELLAETSLKTALIANSMQPNPPVHMQRALLDRHFSRKHGKNAYYGQ